MDIRVGTNSGDKWICPLCKHKTFIAITPDKLWWHLATEHKTTELALQRFAFSYAIKRGWIKEEISISGFSSKDDKNEDIEN